MNSTISIRDELDEPSTAHVKARIIKRKALAISNGGSAPKENILIWQIKKQLIHFL